MASPLEKCGTTKVLLLNQMACGFCLQNCITRLWVGNTTFIGSNTSKT
jgi:hypothetical protein